MRKFLIVCPLLLLFSCMGNQRTSDNHILSVSIAPYKYIVEAIAGDDFTVNVMVPAGASPHSYEPYPDQIKKLEKSSAYIANGYLDFETTWFDRFKSINKNMKMIQVSDHIDLLSSTHIHHHDDEEESHHHDEIAMDPHFWLSPKNGMAIAAAVKDMLIELNPSAAESYEKNFNLLSEKIKSLDVEADSLFSLTTRKAFVIYHPNLAYLAKDYGLTELAIEQDGKEPSPSELKHLIDEAKEEGITTVFIQKEYDKRYAQTLSSDLNANVVVIDPLSEDWINAIREIIESLYTSLIN